MQNFDKENEKPHENTDIIFFMGVTRMSVDDKTGIPVGEPGKLIRTNVIKLHASLGFQSTNKSVQFLDHDFHLASIRPSLILIVKILFE